MVKVRWSDPAGRKHRETALLEDIAAHGACLQLDKAVRLGTPVTIEHAKGKMSGSVRYCIYQEIGYFVGVQFAPDSEWSRSRFTPEHMLDLEQLVMRQARKTGHARKK
jgi:hypothetical protein